MALVVHVGVNQKLICGFALVNTGSRNEKGEYRYRFQFPVSLNHYEIFHDRKKPWYELVEKAIAILKENEGDVLAHGSFVPTVEELQKSIEEMKKDEVQED
jgi:hypothetical protein